MDRWNEVFENEELTKRIVTLDAANAQIVLSENGFEFSLEEIEKEIEIVKAAVARAQSGELNENALDDVAGGVSHKDYLLAGIVVGVCVAAAGW